MLQVGNDVYSFSRIERCVNALWLLFWHVQVTLVGMVHNKDERNIDTSFMLDDTTGQIEVKRWLVLFVFD